MLQLDETIFLLMDIVMKHSSSSYSPIQQPWWQQFTAFMFPSHPTCETSLSNHLDSIPIINKKHIFPHPHLNNQACQNIALTLHTLLKYCELRIDQTCHHVNQSFPLTNKNHILVPLFFILIMLDWMIMFILRHSYEFILFYLEAIDLLESQPHTISAVQPILAILILGCIPIQLSPIFILFWTGLNTFNTFTFKDDLSLALIIFCTAALLIASMSTIHLIISTSPPLWLFIILSHACIAKDHIHPPHESFLWHILSILLTINSFGCVPPSTSYCILLTVPHFHNITSEFIDECYQISRFGVLLLAQHSTYIKDIFFPFNPDIPQMTHTHYTSPSHPQPRSTLSTPDSNDREVSEIERNAGNFPNQSPFYYNPYKESGT